MVGNNGVINSMKIFMDKIILNIGSCMDSSSKLFRIKKAC